MSILLTHPRRSHWRARRDAAASGYCRWPLGGPHLNSLILDEARAARWGRLSVGEHRLRVQHAPGHIADRVCFLVEGDVTAVVGDTLFDGGPNQDLVGRRFRRTLDTLRQVLQWPDDTVCYPSRRPAFPPGRPAGANRGLPGPRSRRLWRRDVGYGLVILFYNP